MKQALRKSHITTMFGEYPLVLLQVFSQDPLKKHKLGIKLILKCTHSVDLLPILSSVALTCLFFLC